MTRLLSQVRQQLVTAGVKPIDGLVVAVSGGADSMALLDVMRGLNYSLTVVHVHHGLRKAADKDAELVEKYCQKNGLAYVMRKVDLGSRKTSIEERARELRYAELKKVAQQVKAKWIVTAHTADDQVETIIANWLRGSLVRGLGGMRLASGGVVRPLLDVHKRELLDYAKQHKLRYVVDATNFDVKFTRNQIRHRLLPELRKFNPRLGEQILLNAQMWQEMDWVLRDLAQQYLRRSASGAKDKISLSVSQLNELTPLMRGEVLKVAVQSVGRELANLRRVHFEEVMKIMMSPRTTVVKRRLGGELFCSKAYGKITISRD